MPGGNLENSPSGRKKSKTATLEHLPKKRRWPRRGIREFQGLEKGVPLEQSSPNLVFKISN